MRADPKGDPDLEKLGFESSPRAHRKQAPGDVLGAFSAPGLTLDSFERSQTMPGPQFS